MSVNGCVCIECQRVYVRDVNVQYSHVSGVVCAIIYAHRRLFANVRKFKVRVYTFIHRPSSNWKRISCTQVTVVINFLAYCARNIFLIY